MNIFQRGTIYDAPVVKGGNFFKKVIFQGISFDYKGAAIF